MDRELGKQFKKLDKQEKRILNRKENQLIKKKVEPAVEKIQAKIPIKLKSSLEGAFYKGFQLVFEKGSVFIEKTYNKDKLKLEHELNNYAIDKGSTKKYVKKLDAMSNRSRLINSLISGLEGGALGALGIGLPDIPLFISMILKTIYQVALSYGYDYESNEEKAYILLLICGAVSKGREKKEFNQSIDMLGQSIDEGVYYEINLEEQMRVTAKVLSDALLAAKFIQGLPVIGVVGGIVNYSIIKKVGRYSGVKYKKRYLIKKAVGKMP